MKYQREALSKLTKGLCVVTTLSLITKLIFIFPLKGWFIIGFGVRAFNRISSILTIICLACALITIVITIPLLRLTWRERCELDQAMKEQHERLRKLTGYIDNNDELPGAIRERLAQLNAEMPHFYTVINACLNQMDTMDRLQKRQSVLIQTNDASFLEETVEVVNDVECAICRNIQSIINLCIVAGDLGEIDYEAINQIVSRNAEKLDDTQTLLTASAEWINKNNSNPGADHREVERWVQAIRQSLSKED